jgi:putative ABC transport system permease protein
VHGFFSPLRFAWRSLVSRPAFSLIVIACLTLGIAVNTTVFAVFDGILWRPFDFTKPEQLVVLGTRLERGDGTAGLSVLTFRDVQRESRSFEAMAAVSQRSMTITEGEEPERLIGASISWNLFPMLGQATQLGRGLRADEDAGAPPGVVLLSDGLWKRRFAADRGIIGRSVQVNGSPLTVIGVMPPRFMFPERAELWVPLGDYGRLDTRDRRSLSVFARLRENTSITEAEGEYSSIIKRLEAEAGLAALGWRGSITTLRDEFIPDDIRLVVTTMFGAVVFVLLIACANVANLMLARMTSRQREIAVRTALGAGRWTIIRHLVLEAVIMAMIAGVLSIPLARFGLRLVDRGIPAGDPAPYYIAWSIDNRVLLYTVIVSILTGIVFGLFPALQSTAGNLYGSLKEGGRGSGSSRAKNRTRSALVVAEVALALVLLVGASLFVRSFATLRQESVGFDTAPILTMRAFLEGTGYDSLFARQQRIEDIVRRVESLPGVTAVTASSLVPLDGGGTWSRPEVQGRAWREEDAPWMWWSGVTAGWSKTLDLDLVAGRDLSVSEASSRSPVAVIDDRLGATLWPNESALGRTFRMHGDSALPWFTVVGVVRHYRHGQLGDRDEDPASVYVPLPYLVPRGVGLMARVSGDPSTFVAAIRSQIRAADPLLPVYEVMPMDQVRALGYWQYELFGWMFGVFGAVALLLAAIGVYGVISYGVSQRTQEFGVRLALGAQPKGVLTLVVRGALQLAIIGIAIGLAGALGVTQALRSILVVSPTDPVSFVGVATFLMLVAIVAGYFPARRATSVDPIVALRAE